MDPIPIEILWTWLISIPSFIGTLPAIAKHFLKRFPAETLRPGDVLITNDPWTGTGHVHDIFVVVPIFHQTRLVGFAAITSHMPISAAACAVPASARFTRRGCRSRC